MNEIVERNLRFMNDENEGGLMGILKDEENWQKGLWKGYSNAAVGFYFNPENGRIAYFALESSPFPKAPECIYQAHENGVLEYGYFYVDRDDETGKLNITEKHLPLEYQFPETKSDDKVLGLLRRTFREFNSQQADNSKKGENN